MSNEEAELIAKRVFRKIIRMYIKEALLTVKILGLWFLCAFVVFLVATIFGCSGTPNTPLWIWIKTVCIVSAAVVMVLATLRVVEQLKKSPRNGNSDRGQRK